MDLSGLCYPAGIAHRVLPQEFLLSRKRPGQGFPAAAATTAEARGAPGRKRKESAGWNRTIVGPNEFIVSVKTKQQEQHCDTNKRNCITKRTCSEFALCHGMAWSENDRKRRECHSYFIIKKINQSNKQPYKQATTYKLKEGNSTTSDLHVLY